MCTLASPARRASLLEATEMSLSEEPTRASTSNPFGDLDFVEDDHKKSEKDTLVFSKKKIGSKPNSRRGSKKEKKSNDDEHEMLKPAEKSSAISLPVSMAAGGAIFMLWGMLAMAAYMY